MAPLDLSEETRRKVDALGDAGRRWLEELPGVVADLASRWDLDVGGHADGGSSGYVGFVTTADGTEAVLKVAIPDGLEGNSPFAGELLAVRLAAGRGYPAVLEVDEGVRAMLLERLGRPLEALGWPVQDQIDAIVATVVESWHPAPPRVALRTGADQARFLHGFVASTWAEAGRPCAEGIITLAQQFALARHDAVDSATAVVIHGDAHPGNVLEDPAHPGRFKLIDPDAMVSERAHDVAIPLRDFTSDLVDVDDPAAVVRGWCERAAAQAGVDAEAVWQWAFTERVSTGLYLCRLGSPDGPAMLRVAERCLDARR